MSGKWLTLTDTDDLVQDYYFGAGGVIKYRYDPEYSKLTELTYLLGNEICYVKETPSQIRAMLSAPNDLESQIKKIENWIGHDMEGTKCPH